MSTSIKRVFGALVVLTVILLTGTIGYIITEEWSPLESLWMTVITMSTVGFGEVHPLDKAGQVLTIILILSTLLVGTYAIGNISAFLIGGEIAAILKDKKMERTIERLKNHAILIGFGAVGREAARNWQDKGLIIVEKDTELVNRAQKEGYMTISGDATRDSILISAGIKRAKGIMIAIGYVADTVLISLTAKELNPGINLSARIDDVHAVSKLRRVGVKNIVLPSQIGGRRLVGFLKQPRIVDFLDMVMGQDELSLKLEEVLIEPGSILVGKYLSDSNIREASGGALVMSIYQQTGKHIVAPPPNYSLQSGDILIVLGTDESIPRVADLAEKG